MRSMGCLRRLARDQSGAIAVEMGFVGPPFFLLIVVILDLSIMLATQSMLDGAARDAARLIRTGQVAAAGNSITTFQTLLCSDMSPLMTTTECQTNVIFDVQVFSTFGSVSFPSCTLNANQTGTGTICNFSPGNGGDVVGVRATYIRPFIVPWAGACLSGGTCWTGLGTTSTGSNPGTDSATLISTVIFQNEPFS